jgi:hypothetical protein
MAAHRRNGLGAMVAMALAIMAPASGRAAEGNDPLAEEIERWSAFLRGNSATDEIWKQIKEGGEPALARAQQAQRDGRRWLALLRLAAVRSNLAAAAYMGERPVPERKETGAFEAEWRRMGSVLRDDLRAPSPAALADVRPAAVRALGESARPRVRVYYDASLEYGRSTTPDSGLFYLGSAQAERDFAAFARRLSAPTVLKPPPVRGLEAELDALEGELLASYRPPASIDKHGDFISASAAVKEARELDAAGLRYGALLRYLQAVLRAAPLRAAGRSDAAVTARRLREQEARLADGNVDHSLGRIFLEAAQSDLAEHAADGAAATAAAVVSDVLPRYFAALGPPPPRAARSAPRVTVTLVRWPYT